MTEDFRSDRMETPEGKGNAKSRFDRAWSAYVKTANKAMPKSLVGSFGSATAVDLLGFWLVWQVEGGFEGMRRLGMSRSSIYRRIKIFRKLTGLHPDEYVMPGVTIDVAAYLSGTGFVK